MAIWATGLLPRLLHVARYIGPAMSGAAGIQTRIAPGPRLSHWKYGIEVGSDDILRNVVNSLIVAVLTAILTACVATLAGYGFALFRFRGSGVLFGLVLLAFMVPFQAVLTPAFAVPRELIDAARADGASVIRMLAWVLRPLIVPGIATSALYAFLFAWTEFLAALTFLTNDSLFTLPVALINVEAGNYGAINYGLLLAGAVIAMIPCVVVYVALQRFYVRGLVSGAIKG